MEKSNLSCYNSLAPSPALPESVVLNDCTLREGIQGLGVPLTPELAAELARWLDRAGVPQFQMGMFETPEIGARAVGAIRRAAVKAKIEGLVPLYGDWEAEIDRMAAIGVDVLNLMHATSPLRLQSLGMTQTEMLDRAVESVGRAAATGLTVTFTPADTTRTDAAFFAKVTEAVHHAGAQRIVITDTAGCASPRGIGALVTLARTVAPIQIQVHCHNDFGLALAAVLAAVEAGATVVDTTVLGFGERAGNAALDEVAVALEALYDVKTGLDLTQLTGLAVVVAQQLGMAISPMKPLVGPHAFHWNHVDIPTPLSADAVGNTQWV